jgi:hypothetical protein
MELIGCRSVACLPRAGLVPQRSYFRLLHTCRPNSEKNTKLYARMAACSLRALGRGNQTPASGQHMSRAWRVGHGNQSREI